MPPLRLATSLVALAIGLSACTRVGSVTEQPPVPEPPLAPAVQVYGGTVSLAGQDFALTLELRKTNPPNHLAALAIPEISLEARGGGTLTPERMSLELSYGGDCPGALRVEARVENGGSRATGALEATDCTGTESGPLRLLRRPEGTLGDRRPLR